LVVLGNVHTRYRAKADRSALVLRQARVTNEESFAVNWFI
jgi:hypothetical protein